MPERDPVETAVDFSCPNCGRRVCVPLGVVRGGGTVRCLGGHPLDLRVGRVGLPQVDRFLGDLLQAIGRLDAPADAPATRRRGDAPRP